MVSYFSIYKKKDKELKVVVLNIPVSDLVAFSVELGGCPSLRSVKERGPTVLK